MRRMSANGRQGANRPLRICRNRRNYGGSHPRSDKPRPIKKGGQSKRLADSAANRLPPRSGRHHLLIRTPASDLEDRLKPSLNRRKSTANKGASKTRRELRPRKPRQIRHYLQNSRLANKSLPSAFAPPKQRRIFPSFQFLRPALLPKANHTGRKTSGLVAISHRDKTKFSALFVDIQPSARPIIQTTASKSIIYIPRFLQSQRPAFCN